MRKTTGAIVFCVLLFISSLVPAVLASAQPTNLPHEDPDRAESIFQAHDLLSSYSILLEFVTYSRFDDIDSMFDLLEAIVVPDEIRSAIDVYNTVLEELSASLSSIDELLGEAEDLIDDALFAEAEFVLSEVEEDLGQVERKIHDMVNGFVNMAEQMGGLVTNTSLFDSAYDLHEEMLARVHESNAQYQELYQRLKGASESRGLPTELTLILSSDMVYVGQQITLEGTLNDIDDTDNPVALPGREIVLQLGASATVLRVQTDIAGDYNGTLTIPYNYTASITAKASFRPVSGYKSSHVESEVAVGFFDTGLELVGVPTRLLSGYPFTVSGMVIGDGAQISGRSMQLNLNGELLGAGFSETGGLFELDGIAPANLALGNHQLEVAVLQDNNNQSSGASQSVSVNISQDVPSVIVNAPSYVFASSSARFDGNVSYNGLPVKDAVVNVVFENVESSTATDDDGDFEIDLKLPLSLVVLSSKTALVLVQPGKDWLGSVEMERSFVVLSLLSIGFFSLAVIASGAAIFSLTKKRRSLLSIRQETPSDDAYSVSQRKFLVEREGILAAYDKASAVVQEFTGVIAGSNMTLRDYLNELDPKLGRMKRIFTDITGLAEIALYSANPDSGDAEEADRLLSELTGELINESA